MAEREHTKLVWTRKRGPTYSWGQNVIWGKSTCWPHPAPLLAIKCKCALLQKLTEQFQIKFPSKDIGLWAGDIHRGQRNSDVFLPRESILLIPQDQPLNYLTCVNKLICSVSSWLTELRDLRVTLIALYWLMMVALNSHSCLLLLIHSYSANENHLEEWSTVPNYSNNAVKGHGPGLGGCRMSIKNNFKWSNSN